MILFLIASGLSLIFGVTRTINFAHGSFLHVGGLPHRPLAAALALGGGNFYIGALLASLAVAILGCVIEVCFLRRVYRAPELYSTPAHLRARPHHRRWGEILVGPGEPDRFPAGGPGGPFRSWASHFPHTTWASWRLARWWRVSGSFCIAPGGGSWFAPPPPTARWWGRWASTRPGCSPALFVVGSWLAGLAGALQVPRQPLTTVMDAAIIVEAFVVVVIGGMGNVFGASWGRCCSASCNRWGFCGCPESSTWLLVFVLMAVVLVVRPWGLVGSPRQRPMPTPARRVGRTSPRSVAAGGRSVGGRRAAPGRPLAGPDSWSGCWWKSWRLRSSPGVCNSWWGRAG